MNRLKYIAPAAFICGSCSGNVADRPNIIYVFPDQFRNCAMSFWDEDGYSEAYGWRADPVQTPNLNSFAGESLVLSRAFSTCPLSSPYRGMFLTGMYPERNGVILNCMAERPFNTLREDAVCISDVLAAAGYSCGYIGKLHAEVPMKNDPAAPGCYVSDRRPEWDAYTPPERRHGYSFWYSYGTFDEHKNPHYWDTEGVRHDPHEFSVKHETDKAIEFLRNRNGERKKDAPFFLTLAYNPPHSPYQGLDDCMEEDYALYRDRSLGDLYVRDNADTTMSKAASARYYFANVTAVDREFGRLLDEVRKLGLERNTIVIFTADHGETMCSHGIADPKNSIWTESFNVPFIIRYPGILKHRVDTSTFMTAVDIMPTLLSMSGLGDMIPDSVEGNDLFPALKGDDGAYRPAAALYMRNLDGDMRYGTGNHLFFPAARGVRTQRYTMEITVRRDTTLAGIRIFDDIADPYQQSNISWKKNPELFRELVKVLEEKLREADDIWWREGFLEKAAVKTSDNN